MAIRVHAFPHTPIQYQTVMCQLFSLYPVGVCIRYDSLYRQAVARDKSRLVPWDQVKEDILVWCATRHPFRPSKPTFITLAIHPHPDRVLPVALLPSPVGTSLLPPQGRRSADASVTRHLRPYQLCICPQVLDRKLWWRPFR